MANIKVNDQQERSPQGTQHDTQGQQGGLSRSGGSSWPARSQDWFQSPFTIGSPFSMMRRMLAALEPDVAEDRWIPALEVSRSNGDLIVCADLPGLRPEDIKLEVADGALVMQGERRSDRQENDGEGRRTEVRYGHFYRTIPLPEGADIEHARAKFEHGVLEVKVPLPQQHTRKIPIETAAQSRSQVPSQTTSPQAGGSQRS